MILMAKTVPKIIPASAPPNSKTSSPRATEARPVPNRLTTCAANNRRYAGCWRTLIKEALPSMNGLDQWIGIPKLGEEKGGVKCRTSILISDKTDLISGLTNQGEVLKSKAVLCADLTHT